MTYPPHPLADLFPLMDAAELDALAADIQARGQADPIMLLDGRVLDGRNRQAACERAGVAPRYEGYVGGDPAGYVVSRNLHRRHLTTGQRAMVAAKLANIQAGQFVGNQHTEVAVVNLPRPLPNELDRDHQPELVTLQQAASLLDVSKSAVQHGKTVMEDGVPELIKLAEEGDVSVSAAATVAAELEPHEQEEIVAAGPAAVKAKAAELRGKPAASPAASKSEAAALAREVEALSALITRWMRTADGEAVSFVRHVGHLQAAQCVPAPFTLSVRDEKGRPTLAGLNLLAGLLTLAAGRDKPLAWFRVERWWQARIAGGGQVTDDLTDEHSPITSQD